MVFLSGINRGMFDETVDVKLRPLTCHRDLPSLTKGFSSDIGDSFFFVGRYFVWKIPTQWAACVSGTSSSLSIFVRRR